LLNKGDVMTKKEFEQKQDNLQKLVDQWRIVINEEILDLSEKNCLVYIIVFFGVVTIGSYKRTFCSKKIVAKGTFYYAN
jgi:hypothetical protein